MPLRIKDGPAGGGTWRAAPASGKLAIKSGGVWKTAATAKVKIGAQGGGSWLDSGYLGFPGVPGAPYATSWGYYTIDVQGAAPTTGSPVANYEGQLLNEAGAVVSSGPLDTAYGYPRWYMSGLTPDTKYQVRFRSKGTNGLYSDWTSVLKFKMGHAEVHTPMSEYRTRPWYNVAYTGDGGDGHWIVCANGANVTTTLMRIEVALANGSNPFCGTASRKAKLIAANNEYLDVGYKTNPWTEDLNWGTNVVAWNGIMLYGSGWWPPNGWAGHGYIHLWGNETYLYSWDQVTPAVPNSYW